MFSLKNSFFIAFFLLYNINLFAQEKDTSSYKSETIDIVQFDSLARAFSQKMAQHKKITKSEYIKMIKIQNTLLQENFGYQYSYSFIIYKYLFNHKFENKIKEKMDFKPIISKELFYSKKYNLYFGVKIPNNVDVYYVNNYNYHVPQMIENETCTYFGDEQIDIAHFDSLVNIFTLKMLANKKFTFDEYIKMVKIANTLDHQVFCLMSVKRYLIYNYLFINMIRDNLINDMKFEMIDFKGTYYSKKHDIYYGVNIPKGRYVLLNANFKPFILMGD